MRIFRMPGTGRTGAAAGWGRAASGGRTCVQARWAAAISASLTGLSFTLPPSASDAAAAAALIGLLSVTVNKI